MKKTAILLVFIGIVVFWVRFFYFQPQKTVSPLGKLQNMAVPSPTITPFLQERSETLFVPYWSFGSKKIVADEFDKLLYFGISGTEDGIDTNDPGYKKLDQFVKLAPQNTNKMLVVRMIDSDVNSKVLENKPAQQRIIDDTIQITKQYGFSGVVLDFEIKALAFDSVVRNITQFYTSFAKSTHSQHLPFAITIYGDTFYRARPYDMQAIGKLADEIYIMTYDFHKSGGDPGPNFPLSGKDTYGYDLKTMLNDFSAQLPMVKTIITLGLFGYDWTVDNNGQSISSGVPLSFAEIQKKYLGSCNEKNCLIKRDPLSEETTITFIDSDSKKHIIWFEDPTSLEKKKEYIQTKGLRSTGVWAYSYY